jgi:hypothetical protein
MQSVASEHPFQGCLKHLVSLPLSSILVGHYNPFVTLSAAPAWSATDNNSSSPSCSCSSSSPPPPPCSFLLSHPSSQANGPMPLLNKGISLLLPKHFISPPIMQPFLSTSAPPPSQLAIFFSSVFHLPASLVASTMAACLEAAGPTSGTDALVAADIFLRLNQLTQETAVYPSPLPSQAQSKMALQAQSSLALLPPPTSPGSSCHFLCFFSPYFRQHHNDSLPPPRAPLPPPPPPPPPPHTPSSLYSALCLVHSKLLFVWRSRRLRALGSLQNFDGNDDADLYECLQYIKFGAGERRSRHRCHIQHHLHALAITKATS